MIYLTKDQFSFLKRLSKVHEITADSLNKSEKLISSFLDEQGLVHIKRQSIPHMSMTNQTMHITYRKGSWISVSISESGKAYIAEKWHNMLVLLFKDVFIPVTVSIITNLLIFGMQLLLPLLQQSPAGTP